MFQENQAAGFLKLSGPAKITLALMAILIVAAAVVLSGLFRVIVIQGSSMEPTLTQGEVAILQIHGRELRPGRVVGVQRHAEPDEGYVKRINADAGDTKQTLDGRTFTLGPGQYWVNGDYRWAGEAINIDSDHFGPVERSEIKGVLIASTRAFVGLLNP